MAMNGPDGNFVVNRKGDLIVRPAATPSTRQTEGGNEDFDDIQKGLSGNPGNKDMGLGVEHEEDPCDSIQKENERLRDENNRLIEEARNKKGHAVHPKKSKPGKPGTAPSITIINNVNPQQTQINGNAPGLPGGADRPTSPDHVNPFGPGSGEGSSRSSSPRTLTQQEVRQAASDGKRVAKMLIGYTSDSEQATTKEIIQDRVTSDNVVDFMRGYEEEHGLMGDKFFEQLYSEYGFDDKADLMMNVAQKLAKYCEDHGAFEKADRYEELISAFQSHNGTPTDVTSIIKELDKLTKKVIRY